MTETGGTPIPEAIHEAAEEWLARLAGQVDPAAERAFAAWIEADPRHRIAYDRIKRDWQLGTLLKERKVGQTRSLGRAPFWMRQKTHIAAASLGVAALLGLVTAGLVRPGGPLTISAAAQAAIYETAVGEIRKVRLADGSTVILDTSTRLRVKLSEGDRRLDLEQGRARFHVTSDRKRPFRVLAAGGEITAHGTLDVSMIGAKPVVTVLDGSVELRRPGAGSDQTRMVARGESLVLDGRRAEQETSPVDVPWVSGMLALDATPLAGAVAAINRYNKVQLRLAEPFTPPVRVTGAFRVRDPEGFARAVAASVHLKIERPDSGTILLVGTTRDANAAL